MTETSLISLRGLELIITYRGASQERRDNLRGVLRHLNRTYSDYQIWLIEADAAPTFSWSEFGDSKIKHVFIHDTGPFPKARLVNLGALMDQNSSDVLCPFTRVLNVSGNRRQSFIESGNFDEFAPFLASDLPDDMSLLYVSTPGAINFFRRAEFIRVGGLNPGFIGWGGEDDELFVRAARLGVRWHSFSNLQATLFHLNHDSASRTQLVHEELTARNRQMAFQTDDIPMEELEARAAELAKYFR